MCFNSGIWRAIGVEHVIELDSSSHPILLRLFSSSTVPEIDECGGLEQAITEQTAAVPTTPSKGPNRKRAAMSSEVMTPMRTKIPKLSDEQDTSSNSLRLPPIPLLTTNTTAQASRTSAAHQQRPSQQSLTTSVKTSQPVKKGGLDAVVDGMGVLWPHDYTLGQLSAGKRRVEDVKRGRNGEVKASNAQEAYQRVFGILGYSDHKSTVSSYWKRFDRISQPLRAKFSHLTWHDFHILPSHDLIVSDDHASTSSNNNLSSVPITTVPALDNSSSLSLPAIPKHATILAPAPSISASTSSFIDVSHGTNIDSTSDAQVAPPTPDLDVVSGKTAITEPCPFCEGPMAFPLSIKLQEMLTALEPLTSPDPSDDQPNRRRASSIAIHAHFCHQHQLELSMSNLSQAQKKAWPTEIDFADVPLRVYLLMKRLAAKVEFPSACQNKLLTEAEEWYKQSAASGPLAEFSSGRFDRYGVG